MLHIVNGLATLELLDRTDIRGARVSGDDIFAEGPVTECLETEKSWQLRADYLQKHFRISKEEYLERRAERERNLRSFAYHEEIVLWFEFDLFCQANLLYLLNWFSKHDLANSKLSMICPGSFPGIKQFRGLGSLAPKQLSSLFPERVLVSPEQLSLAQRAWKAYSSPDPTEIESLLSEDTDALPHLRSAFTAHLERFPSKRNGLNHIQQKTLELLAEGAKKFADLFVQVSSSEKAYAHGMADRQFSVYLSELAEIDTPIIRIDYSPGVLRREIKTPAKSTIKITDLGREVLSGKQNFVRVAGIDRWLGGVQLTSGAKVWFWDQDKRKLVREGE